MFQQIGMFASLKLFAFSTVVVINSSIICIPGEMATLVSLFLICEAFLVHSYFQNSHIDRRLFLKTLQIHVHWIIKTCCSEQKQHKTFDCIMPWVYLVKKAGEVTLNCLNKVQGRVSLCQLL